MSDKKQKSRPLPRASVKLLASGAWSFFGLALLFFLPIILLYCTRLHSSLGNIRGKQGNSLFPLHNSDCEQELEGNDHYGNQRFLPPPTGCNQTDRIRRVFSGKLDSRCNAIIWQRRAYAYLNYLPFYGA